MKKRIKIPTLSTDWILLGFVLWFGSGIYLYIFTQGGPKPLYSYIMFLTVLFFYLLSRATLNIPIFNKKERSFWSFILWLIAYLIFVMVGFLYSSYSEIAKQRLVTAIEIILLAGSFTYLMTSSKALKKVSAAMAFLALFAAIINFWDFLHPVFTKSPGRAAGFYINPNESGYFIALAMVAGILEIPRKQRLFYLFACSVGVLFTFSRSAYLMVLIAFIGLWQQGQLRGTYSRIAILLLCLFACIVTMGVFTISLDKIADLLSQPSTQSYLTQDTQVRFGLSAPVSEDPSTIA